jgi:hypothetical protein
VRTRSRIGLAQVDWMSPVLGAAVSVMNIVAGLEDGPLVRGRARPEAGRGLRERDTAARQIGRAGA